MDYPEVPSLIFQSYLIKLNSSRPVPHFNPPPPGPRLSISVLQSRTLAIFALFDSSIYFFFVALSVTIHKPLLRLRVRAIFTSHYSIPAYRFCPPSKIPLLPSHILPRTLHTFQRFAAAALRPRQFLTNNLHLQYYPQYLSCPILSQSDFRTSAFRALRQNRPFDTRPK